MGALDADSAPFAIGSNSWVNAQNIRSGSTDKGFTAWVESIGGTLRKSTPSPSVSFIEIGNTADEVGRRIIYAYYNLNTSEHKIEVYDFDTDTIYLALLSSQVEGGLNFSKDYPIHGRIVNGIWYFTDNYNAPRKLNIDAAIKMNNPSYSTDELPYTNPLESDVITIIRKPPAYPLSVDKITLGTVTVNNVADFAGFFSWRFTFRDNETSVLSEPSELINYNISGETSDVVRIVAVDIMGDPQHISQDVQTVDICVKYVGTENYFIIKTWDRRIAADAAAIAANNSGTPLSFNFFNDVTGIALDVAYSVKPFDSVPLLSKTIETGLSRLFLGCNTESFDTPVLSSLAASLVAETNHAPFQNPSFKSASPYQVGIIFKDKYKRVIGNVITNSALRLQVPERDYNNTTYYFYIAWTLSNAVASSEIPIEAYYYEAVVTKNLRTRFFVQSKSGGMKYAIKDPLTSVITYQDTYISTAYGLAFNNSILNAEGMGYFFQDGDILKVYRSTGGTIFSLPVLGIDAGYVLTKLENLGSFATQPDIIYEIYSPYKESFSEPFWTHGEVFPVTNPTESSRQYSSLGGIIYGDIYNFNRVAGGLPYVAENMASNVKYWKQWNVNAGQINLVLHSEQVLKQTAVRWSNVIIAGSQTNGLSTFDAPDEKILPLNLGILQKLQQTSKVEEQGNIMLAIGEQETASCYLGEVQLVGAASNAFVASAPNVIGTINVLKGSFGTINPESVVEYRGNVYWLDMNNGRYIQYSTNGLFPISNYKMIRFWKNWCEKFLSMTSAEIEELGGRPFVFSSVDPFHDELLIATPRLSTDSPKGVLPLFEPGSDVDATIIYPFDILDLQGKTIVYDLISNSWRGSYSFTPEGFSVLQNQLYSFKNGQFYLHNQTENPCEFYGVQYTAKIIPVSNLQPNIPKIYNSLTLEVNIPPLYVYIYNDFPYQQISDLVDYQFRSLEGVQNTTILRNIIQPTATGNTVDSRLTGEKMRGIYMYFMLEFTVSATKPLQLRFMNIGFTFSSGNNNTIP